MRAKRLVCLLLAGALCLLAGCSGPAASQPEPQRYTTIFYDVFDTMTQVIAYCDSEEEFQRQTEALHQDLHLNNLAPNSANFLLSSFTNSFAIASK